MPCYQAIVVNSFDPTERLSTQESWDLLVQANPVFATLEGAKEFARKDAGEWLAAQNEDRDPQEDHLSGEIVWTETKPGTIEGRINDSSVDQLDWFAIIIECKFLDTGA